MNEILEKAGCPNLIDEMSAEELRKLYFYHIKEKIVNKKRGMCVETSKRT